MVLISLLFCFFDNRNIDILRTGEEEGEAAKFIAAYKSPDYTDRSKADEKKEQAYSILEQIPMYHEVFALMRNKLYMFVTLTVTVIMFSAAGL